MNLVSSTDDKFLKEQLDLVKLVFNKAVKSPDSGAWFLILPCYLSAV